MFIYESVPNGKLLVALHRAFGFTVQVEAIIPDAEPENLADLWDAFTGLRRCRNVHEHQDVHYI